MAPVILITGSTDGLGRALARELAVGGAAVVLHGRDRGRAEAAARAVAEAAGGTPPPFHIADLSSLAEVRRLAGEVRAQHDRLDVLVNNAGVGGLGDRELTVDGNELRFAVNYLATFLLTQELLPLLRQSAPARVVNVASAGQAPLDFDDLTMERDYDPWRAYMRSKLAQIMYTFELASRLGPDTGLTVNALHPGTFMPTKMVLGAGIAPVTALEQGVAATQRLCTAPELAGVTCRYFDGQQEARVHRQAYDADARRQLWEISERLCA